MATSFPRLRSQLVPAYPNSTCLEVPVQSHTNLERKRITYVLLLRSTRDELLRLAHHCLNSTPLALASQLFYCATLAPKFGACTLRGWPAERLQAGSRYKLSGNENLSTNNAQKPSYVLRGSCF